jgi:hypothetical protein
MLKTRTRFLPFLRKESWLVIVYCDMKVIGRLSLLSNGSVTMCVAIDRHETIEEHLEMKFSVWGESFSESFLGGDDLIVSYEPTATR